MKRVVFENCRIVSPSRDISRGYVLVVDGVVREVGVGRFEGCADERIDLDGLTLLPGFVDTHTHGVEGFDVTASPSPDTVLEMARRFVKYGVTGFVPTTVSAPRDVLVMACRAVREASRLWKPSIGARILGLHLEGPYLNREAAGAQNTEFLRLPSVEEFRVYYEESGGMLKQITIAPELPGAQKLIEVAKSLGVVVSAGHTNASYEVGVEAVRLGVSKATHLFNGMRRFHHRDPGIALALMQSPDVYLEIIADFVHLHPAVVKVVIDYATPKRVVLVTDSIAATGLGDGIYSLGGLEVVVEKGIARLAKTGSLAGSTLTMDKAFRNIVSLGYSPREASTMASYNPAKSIGIGSSIGDIAPGYKADFAVVDDSLGIVKTIIDGEVVYEKTH